MKKLTLDLDALRVDSFPTDVPDERRGTMQGHLWAWSDDSVCPGTTTTRPPY